MAEYFTARGLPVPRELTRNPLTDWRRLVPIAVGILVLYIGLRITDIDLTYANPEYAGAKLRELLNWDTSILTPQNEYETFWDTAEGKMIETIFLGIVATAFSIVAAVPLSFLGARNIMSGNPITIAIYTLVRLVFTVIRSIDVLIVVIIGVILFGVGSAAGVIAAYPHLNAEDVAEALAYYQRHQVEVDGYIARNGDAH